MANKAVQTKNFKVEIGIGDKMAEIAIPYTTKAQIDALNKSDADKAKLNVNRLRLQKLKTAIVRLTNALHTNQFLDAYNTLIGDSFPKLESQLKNFKVDEKLTFIVSWLTGNNEVKKVMRFTWGDVLKMIELRNAIDLTVNSVMVEQRQAVEADSFAELLDLE